MPTDPVSSAVENQCCALLFAALHKKIKNWTRVKENYENLERDLKELVHLMGDHIMRDARSRVSRRHGAQVRELMHDEDCKERFLNRITSMDEAWWLPYIAHAIRVMVQDLQITIASVLG